MTTPDDQRPSSLSPHDQTFNALMLDLRERMVAIETKLDNFQETHKTAYEALAVSMRNERDIADLKTYAVQNRENAVAARSIAENDAADIVEIKEQQRWNTRFIIGATVGILVNLTMNLLQNMT